MKTFVLGDIHGNHKGLVQCLEKSKFNSDEDRLICLGDIVDGLPDTRQCVDELLKLKTCHVCMGNHDLWFLKLLTAGGQPEDIWLKQGGLATLASYGGIMQLDVPTEHLKFFESFYPYIVKDNTVFVHGGFNQQKALEDQELDELVWNRQMVETAWKKTTRNQRYKFGAYDEIFVGHTTTQAFGIWDGTCIVQRRPTVPLHLCNVWMLDTGAGWDGCLTIMDIETKEYWQSDPALQLYPGMGRGLRF